jgi:hypothetical protein
MILIRFPDMESKRKALARLAGRFPFTTWKSGELLVPAAALSELALEGISYTVEGPADYERSVPAIRSADPTAVQ